MDNKGDLVVQWKNIFCNKCGTENQEGTKFCKNCGNSITIAKESYSGNEIIGVEELDSENVIAREEEIEDNIVNKEQEIINNTSIIDEIEEKKEVKGSSKFSKMILSILIGVIILISASFITLKIVQNTINKPEKIVESFKVYISDENYDELTKVVKSSDIRLEINDENLKSMVAYFKSNPSKLNDLCTILINKTLLYKDNNDVITIEKDTGINGILGKYKIVLNPVFLKVTTALDNTNVTINGEDFGNIKKSEVNELGPFIPGEYEIICKYQGDFITLEEKIDKNIIDRSTEECSVFSDIRTVEINTEYDNALVIVNGKNTGKTLDVLGSKISPVDANTKIQLELNVDGKKFTTSEKVVGNKSIITFDKIQDINKYIEKKNIIENFEKNIDNEIIKLMNEYSEAFERAVNDRSFSYLTNTLYPNSELFKAQQDYINISATNKIYERFISLSTKNIKYDPSTTSGTVDVSEVYDTIRDGKSTRGTYYYMYYFKYNEAEKRFQLTDMVTQ